MSLIWVTRGLNWGNRFLLKAAYPNPLAVYETAFLGIEQESEVCRRVESTDALPEMVALRFPDPLRRKDRAGRVIAHDFVVFTPESSRIASVDDGLRLVWPTVSDEFGRIWDSPEPPDLS